MKIRAPRDCKTGFVYFPGLRINVYLEKGQFYRDDGTVDSIRQWERGLFVEEFGRRPTYRRDCPSFYSGMTGLCLVEDMGKRKFVFIAYQKDPFGERYEGRTRVHEEGHALFTFGKEDAVEVVMKKRGAHDMDVHSYGDERGEETVVRMLEVQYTNRVLGVSKRGIKRQGERWGWIPATIGRLEKAGYVFA